MQLSKLDKLFAEFIIWPYIGTFVGIASIMFAGMYGLEFYLPYALGLGALVGCIRAFGVGIGLVQFESKEVSDIRGYLYRTALFFMYGLAIYSVVWPRYIY
ncbi:hypothetical protein A7985_07320 [Pseudoalteromonas luteoviolacea]|uniref:Uncharacterized protein n=1 Tax=Pseudoalteromonas luteoviolacea TaxID=43657 RepID=A0A1C0TWP8_9GAMM|nr:hypothetical protein [Pseudoalteromonas luteoviolacea]MBQ4810267.1 hypothetical protein [Pseudoalteromonas luteoviolacea]OCQ23741.1 hypothetical protein A7985_07320 [Pseudoalteromonas luteoviolacea]